ncbi:hypothetical protein PFLUV_G00220730, partial [Perca fluviatilis]
LLHLPPLPLLSSPPSPPACQTKPLPSLTVPSQRVSLPLPLQRSLTLGKGEREGEESLKLGGKPGRDLREYPNNILFVLFLATARRHYRLPLPCCTSFPLPSPGFHHSTCKMGNEASFPLEMCSHFDADEIKRLGKRFKKLDLDNSGSLSVEEFMSLPELQQNPLVQRVIDIFDTDGNGEVDFKEFIEGVSQFSVKGDKEQKLRFAFRIYDMDKDGYISNGELFQVLKMMVGNNLKDTQLQQIVDKTIINADKDGDGRISFEEFCAVVGGLDIHKKMVVDV